LKRGCATFRARGNGNGEIYTDQGASEKTDKNRRSLGFCFLNGQLSPGSVNTAVTGGTSAGAGLTKAEIIAIVAGAGATAALLAIGLNGGTGRGANPSPSS